MEPMVLTSDFRIQFPETLRKQLGLRPGQKFHAIAVGEHIHLIPIKPLAELCGFAKGIDTNVPRDDDRV